MMLGMDSRRGISGRELPPCSTPCPGGMPVPRAAAKAGDIWGQNPRDQILVLVLAVQEHIRQLVQAGMGWPRAESSLQHGGDPPGPLSCC